MANSGPVKRDMEQAEPISDPNDVSIDTVDEAALEANRNTTLESLEAQIEALKADHLNESGQLKDQLMRALAESDNLRKRAERDLQDASRYAVTNFARDLVSVVENLQRAVMSIPDEARQGNDLLKNMAIGIDMTMKEFLSMLERHGIKRIDPAIGEKFDHNLHQAVSQVESTEYEPGSILQVLQAGYLIHDRLLRPAMVGVAKRSAEAPAHVDTQA